MLTNSPELETYLLNHIEPEGEVLEELSRKTHLNTVYPNMLSGHLQGKILEMISWMMHPTRILEIGTFTGYSAICLARGLAPGGLLQSIDSDDELKDMAQEYIRKSGLEEKVELITGNALDVLKTLSGPYDLIFIDADKKEYVSYYDLCFDLLKPGGFMVADNVLWGGKVVDDKQHNEPDTRGILDFNERVRDDNRVKQVILPVRDGLSLIRKK